MGAHRAVIQEIGAAEKELPKDAKLKRLRNKILATDEQKQERVGKRFLTDSSNWSFGDGGEPGEAEGGKSQEVSLGNHEQVLRWSG